MQTKHPRILTFEWAGETEASGATLVYLVTEPVQPLAELLAEVALEGEQRLMFIGLGLRQAAQAVAFLNNQCKLLHGNVCLDTILVTPALDWRLAFFDMASEHTHLASSLLARCALVLVLAGLRPRPYSRVCTRAALRPVRGLRSASVFCPRKCDSCSALLVVCEQANIPHHRFSRYIEPTTLLIECADHLCAGAAGS